MAIGCIKMMMQEKVLDVEEEMPVNFTNFENAFDRVQWTKQLETLKNLTIDRRDRRLIKNSYLNQTVTVHIPEDWEPGTVRRGAR